MSNWKEKATNWTVVLTATIAPPTFYVVYWLLKNITKDAAMVALGVLLGVVMLVIATVLVIFATYVQGIGILKALQQDDLDELKKMKMLSQIKEGSLQHPYAPQLQLPSPIGPNPNDIRQWIDTTSVEIE